jgi:acyl carrier protein
MTEESDGQLEKQIANYIDRKIRLNEDQKRILQEKGRCTNLQDDLNVDSLDSVEIVLDIEKVYEIKIPDEDAQEFKEVGHVIDYIRDNGYNPAKHTEYEKRLQEA